MVMLYDEGQWRVFYSERGLETGKKTASEIVDACKMVLKGMSETEEEYKQMCHYFARIALALG